MFKIYSSFIFSIVLLFLAQKPVKAQECGVRKIAQGNIIGGNYVKHGQYPW
jgi:hypothetical protein